LTKQADGDNMAGLSGDGVVAKSMGKRWVCWVAVDGRTRVLVWQGYGAVI